MTALHSAYLVIFFMLGMVSGDIIFFIYKKVTNWKKNLFIILLVYSLVFLEDLVVMYSII